MNGARAQGYGISLALCLLTALPLFGLQEKDSFPVSTYPMFSARRGRPTLYKVMLVSQDGRSAPARPELVAGGEVLQAKALITRAVRKGKRAVTSLCRNVAKRAGETPALAQVRTVEVREVQYDPLAYFEAPNSAGTERVLERCSIEFGEGVE